MCGIAGLHLKDDTYRDRLGAMIAGMLRGVAERGPDSAGVAIHSDGLEVLKAVGDPIAFATRIGLATRSGVRALAHTRMATESAVTAAHCHPFAVRPPDPAAATVAERATAAATPTSAPEAVTGTAAVTAAVTVTAAGAGAVDTTLCLVHNGSFANHATVRRRLAAEGVTTETDNDSEVAARYLAVRLAAGDDLATALRRLTATFDGFFTLAVTTANSFAVVRDPIACKPAIIAETDRWVAMVSEYRALIGLPGLADAAVFEPEPEEVYLWAS